jgi:hypothetical protein
MTEKVNPFTIVWKNPNAPIQSQGRELVTCEICGKTGYPFEPWFYYEIPIRAKMYEYAFWVCSEQCGEKANPILDKKRKELNK